jgi:hypothetical protein
MLSCVAFAEFHVKVVEPPAVMVDGLACRETVGTGGGGGEAPPPPQAPIPTTRNERKSTKQAVTVERVGRERAARETWIRSKNVRRTATNSTMGKRMRCRGAAAGGTLGNAAGLELTPIVSVLVSVPFAGRVPAGGLKMQAMPVGSPGQTKVN